MIVPYLLSHIVISTAAAAAAAAVSVATVVATLDVLEPMLSSCIALHVLLLLEWLLV